MPNANNSVWIDESPLASVVNIVSGDPFQGSVSPNSPASGVEYNPLVHGASTYFDGIDDVLNVPYNSNMDFGTDDFTIEFWVKSEASDRYLAGSSASGPNNLSILLSHSSNYWFIIGTSNISINCGSVPPNVWHHVAVSRNSGVWRSYIDGVFTATLTDSRAINIGTGGLFIGKGNSLDSTRFKGFLGAIRFVKGVGLYPDGTSFTPTPVLSAVSGTVLLLNHYNIGIFDSACKVNLHLYAAFRDASRYKYGDSSIEADSMGSYGEYPSMDGYLKNSLDGADFTLETWIYVPTTWDTRVRPIISIGGRFVSGSANFATEDYGRISFYVNGTRILLSSIQMSTNNWHHVAVTRQANTFRIFIDGITQGTVTNSSLYLGNKFFEIAGGDEYNGLNTQLDDLRITRSVARYIGNFTPPTSGLAKA